MLARASLEGRVKVGKMITKQFPLEATNDGSAALGRGESVGSTVVIP
jgi:Zn-dependent alcohol dehydrogenase